jgi:hypothetical protein
MPRTVPKPAPVPTKTRRKYTEEFRREAVPMLLDGHTANSVAQRLGLDDPTILYRWKTNQLQLVHRSIAPHLFPVTASASWKTRIKFPPSSFLMSSGLCPRFSISCVITGYVETSSSCSGTRVMPS